MTFGGLMSISAIRRSDETAKHQLHRMGTEDVLDTSLESPLGRLFHFGKISQVQYEAGIRFAGIALRYLETIGAPRPYGASDPPSDLLRPDDECENAKVEYDRAFEALFCDHKRRRPTMAVGSIAVHEQEPRDDFEVAMLRIGLSALADHFDHKVIPFRRRNG